MNDEKELSGIFKRFGKWWIIIIGLILSAGALIYGAFEIKGFPDEKYTSVAAFIMLIATALLQNIDLDLQRKDLRLNRKALEEQREEMEKHTEEFAKTNKSNDEGLEVQKFFELIRLKEDLYIDIIKERNEVGVNALEEFNDLATSKICGGASGLILKEFEDHIENKRIYYDSRVVEKLYKVLNNNEKARAIELIEQSIQETEVFSGYGQGVENSLVKLHNYNLLLERMIDEGTSGIFGNAFASFKSGTDALNRSIESIMGRPKKSTTIKQIYKGLLTDDEILLYKIIEKRLDPNEIFVLEDAE